MNGKTDWNQLLRDAVNEFQPVDRTALTKSLDAALRRAFYLTVLYRLFALVIGAKR